MTGHLSESGEKVSLDLRAGNAHVMEHGFHGTHHRARPGNVEYSVTVVRDLVANERAVNVSFVSVLFGRDLTSARYGIDCFEADGLRRFGKNIAVSDLGSGSI